MAGWVDSPRLRRGLHFASLALAGAVIAFALLVLGLRFWLLPGIDAQTARVEASASRLLGLPVRIGALRSDWRGLNPRVALEAVELGEVGAEGASAPLRLERVDAVLSWWSLLAGEPRLLSLDLHRLDLTVRRDAAGVWHVGGIAFDPAAPPGPFPDWLLRQRGVRLIDARLVWLDEALGAPPLVLERVGMRLVNRFGRHRFGLVATPPAGVAGRLDLRGDLRGGSVHDLEGWRGQLYARVDGASAAAFRTWAPWAHDAVREGEGSLRFWLDLEAGRPVAVQGDMVARGVRVALADDRPVMRFDRLSGRAGWRQGRDAQVLFVEGLRFAGEGTALSEPANVKARLTPAEDGRLRAARIEASGLRLEAFTALASGIPMPRLVHDWLDRLNPRGFIDTAQIDWQGPERFSLKAWFSGLGLDGGGALPGFSGLDGHVLADQDGGEALLESSGLHYDHPQVFRQPLGFDRLHAPLVWERLPQGGYRFGARRARLGNADLDLMLDGHLDLPAEGAPVAHLTAHLPRGEGSAVWRYLPRQVHDEALVWLRRGIVAGEGRDARMVLKGPLDRFPFVEGGGEFHVGLDVRNATIDYAPGWPRLTGVEGRLEFKGLGMRIDARRGQVLGVELGPVQGEIADIHHHDSTTPLNFEGVARGRTEAFLEFVRQSPVDVHTGHFARRLSARGEGELHLRLGLPLHDIDASRVQGVYRVRDNQLDLGGGLPPLDKVTGRIEFTESMIRGEGIELLLHGQPARVRLGSDKGGRVRIDAEGVWPVSRLATALPPGLARRLSGRAAWRAELGLAAEGTSLAVDADLSGVGIDLPPPLGRRPGQPGRLRVRAEGEAMDRWSLHHDDGLHARYASDPGGHRLAVQFGEGEAVLPERPGVVVRGRLPDLDLDAWRALELGGGGAAPAWPVEIDAQAGALRAFGRDWGEVRARGGSRGSGWRFVLGGAHVDGEVRYEALAGASGMRFDGRFKRLRLAAPVEPAGAPAARAAANGAELPREVALQVDQFAYHGRELGTLAVRLVADGDGHRLDSLGLSAAEGRLEASGWLAATAQRDSRLRLRLSSPNTGHLLRRLDLYEGVRGAEAELSGELRWRGGVDAFGLERLGGKIGLRFRNGRFTKIEPGAGRLLGVLSLQALPRRVTLDFRDVFSEGFSFDSIEGDLHLERGIGYLPGLRIEGPAARVRMSGRIDLERETQDLRVRIQPRLEESAALGAALIGGPVAGVGALVASRILQDPLSRVVNFEYQISGSWADPQVQRLARPPADAEAQTP